MIIDFLKKNKALITSFLLLFAYFIAQKLLEHAGFNTNFFDNYYFDHAVNNIALGKGFYLENFNRHFFTEHFYPFYYLIAPLYVIQPTLIWTMTIHALCLILTLIPLVKFARFRFPNAPYAPYLVMAFSFFVYVPFRGMNMTGLHGEIVMAPIIAWVSYYLAIGKYRPAILLSFTLPLFKENAIVLLIGIALFFAYKRLFRNGAIVFAYGLITTIIVISIIMPNFGLGDYRFVKNYSYLNATSITDVMFQMISNPLAVIRHIFSGPVIGYLMGLFALVLFLPIFSPIMLVGLVLFCQNALSDFWAQLHFLQHYSAPLVPIILMASIDGIGYLKENSPNGFNRIKLVSKIAIPFFVVLNLIFFTFFEFRFFYVRSHSAEIHAQLNMIPFTSSVCATARFAPHLFYRDRIIEFPHCVDEDFIIVEKNDPYFPVNERTDTFAKRKWADGHYSEILFQLIIGERVANRTHYQEQLDALSKRSGYQLINEGQRFLLYARK